MASWIASNSDLRDFIAGLPQGSSVALDTEFAWTKTYYPCFALLQLGVSRSQTAVADPFCITDWSPLADLLADSSRRKVCFSAANDLPILHRATGGTLPVNVFDVQLAAGFCGEEATQSLKSVIEKHLGIVLPKSETRSDWTIRPLSAKQLEYAADDVALLPELASEYAAKLEANGNLRFFEEESVTRFCVPEAYEPTPVEEAWKRLAGIRKMEEEMPRRRAMALAIWRERTARSKDIARPRILSDEQLYWCAYENPSSESALMKMPQCWPKRVRPFATEILGVLSGSLPEEPAKGEYRPIPKERHKALTERVLGFVRKRAQERGIDPAIAISRHDAEAYASAVIRGETYSSRLAIGWRAELFAQGLKTIK